MGSRNLFKYQMKTKERFKGWLQNINVTTVLEGYRDNQGRSWARRGLRNSLCLEGSIDTG